MSVCLLALLQAWTPTPAFHEVWSFQSIRFLLRLHMYIYFIMYFFYLPCPPICERLHVQDYGYFTFFSQVCTLAAGPGTQQETKVSSCLWGKRPEIQVGDLIFIAYVLHYLNAVKCQQLKSFSLETQKLDPPIRSQVININLLTPLCVLSENLI